MARELYHEELQISLDIHATFTRGSVYYKRNWITKIIHVLWNSYELFESVLSILLFNWLIFHLSIPRIGQFAQYIMQKRIMYTTTWKVYDKMISKQQKWWITKAWLKLEHKQSEWTWGCIYNTFSFLFPSLILCNNPYILKLNQIEENLKFNNRRTYHNSIHLFLFLTNQCCRIGSGWKTIAIILRIKQSEGMLIYIMYELRVYAILPGTRWKMFYACKLRACERDFFFILSVYPKVRVYYERIL